MALKPQRNKRTGRFMKRRKKPAAKRRKTTRRKRTYRANPQRKANGQFKRKTATRRAAPRRTAKRKTTMARRKYRKNPPMSPTMKAIIAASLATVADHLLYRFLPAGNLQRFVPAIGKAGIGLLLSRKPKTAVAGRALIVLSVADGVSMLMSQFMPASIPAPTSEGYINLSGVYPGGFPASNQHPDLLPLLRDDQVRIGAAFAMADEGSAAHNVM